jgi:hypothetical protein
VPYNAAVDARVAFDDGVAYRLLASSAKRAGQEPPPEPAKSEKLLPLPPLGELQSAFTRLRGRFAELRRFPWRMLVDVIDDAHAARTKFLKDCGAAKASGKKLPRLRFRGAGDPMDVATDSFMLRTVGRDVSQRKPKRPERKTTSSRVRTRSRAGDRTCRPNARPPVDAFREVWPQKRVFYAFFGRDLVSN